MTEEIIKTTIKMKGSDFPFPGDEVVIKKDLKCPVCEEVTSLLDGGIFRCKGGRHQFSRDIRDYKMKRLKDEN